MKLINFHAGEAEVRGVLQDDYETLKAHKIRPAVIICPGGAYQWRSPREKDPVALEFLSMGYQAFILEYTCGEKASGFRPLRQLAEAVKTVRNRAEEWHIDPQKIAVLGFSAGGHLAASLGTFWNDPELDLGKDSRPDAMILCYPVISTKEFAHEESVRWVTGNDPAMKEKMHLPAHVTSDFPPTFMWHGGEDASVPVENTLAMLNALQRNHISYECHLFPEGKHGLSICSEETGSYEPYNSRWMDMSIQWLNKQFNFKK